MKKVNDVEGFFFFHSPLSLTTLHLHVAESFIRTQQAISRLLFDSEAKVDLRGKTTGISWSNGRERQICNQNLLQRRSEPYGWRENVEAV